MTEKSGETGKALPDVTKGWGIETFELRRPFVFKGGEILAIKVRVPTGADIEAYVQSPGRGVRALAVRLADVPEPVLDAMEGRDYSRLMAFVGKFAAGSD